MYSKGCVRNRHSFITVSSIFFFEVDKSHSPQERELTTYVFMEQLRDIESKADIVVLIDHFYQRAMADSTIGFFFNDVVQLNMNRHMPIMY